MVSRRESSRDAPFFLCTEDASYFAPIHQFSFLVFSSCVGADIKLLIRNAKVFNVPISYVHHLARGLEFEIRRLKRKYGSAMPPAAEAMNGDADGNEHPAAGSGLKPKAALGASLGKRKRPLELEDSKTRPLEGEAIAANVQDSTLIGAAMAAGDDGECVDDPGKDAVMVEPAEKKARFSED